jgi:hypothetical protein
MIVTISFVNKIIVPPPGEYYQLMYDWQTDEYGGGVRPSAPCPATMKSLQDVWIEMGEAFQWWFWDVWNLYRPAGITDDMNRAQWNGYWHSNKAWTNNFNGSDVCASYPTQLNLDQPPMARETLGCRGMTVKLRDNWTHKEQNWWPFDAITNTAHLLYTPLEFAQMWWLCCPATVQTAIHLPDGSYQVNRFTGRNNPASGQHNDVPMPLLTRDGTIWFLRDHLRYVGDGSTRPNPYIPSKSFNPAF